MYVNKNYYLGIMDKYGNEIMSNSEIKFEQHKGSIFYSADDCCFKIKWEDESTRRLTKSFGKLIEII